MYCHCCDIEIQIQNTNNFILHRIKNNKTLAASYFSMEIYVIANVDRQMDEWINRQMDKHHYAPINNHLLIHRTAEIKRAYTSNPGHIFYAKRFTIYIGYGKVHYFA